MTEPIETRTHLVGLYLRNFAANISGNVIIALFNVVTPLQIFSDWQTFILHGGWTLIVFLIPIVFSSAIILQYLIQRPVAKLLHREHAGEKIQDTF